MPHNIIKAAKKGQQMLDGTVQRTSKSKEFMREGVLKAVAEFVMCDDQVSETVSTSLLVTQLLNSLPLL